MRREEEKQDCWCATEQCVCHITLTNNLPSTCPVTHTGKRGTTFRPIGFLGADGLRSGIYLVQNYTRPVKDRGMKKCAPPCFTGVFSRIVLRQRGARARPRLSTTYSLDTTLYRMIQHEHFIWWSCKRNFSSKFKDLDH